MREYDYDDGYNGFLARLGYFIYLHRRDDMDNINDKGEDKG